MTRQHEEEEILQEEVSPEEKAYLASLEQNLSEGHRLARNAPGSRAAGGVKGSAGGGGRFAVSGGTIREIGTILSFPDGAAGLYRGSAAGREGKVIFFLLPDGRIDQRDVDLDSMEVEELGVVPRDFMEEFQDAKRWNREAVVFHVRRWADIRKLPPAVAYNLSEAPPAGGVSPRAGSTPGSAPASPRASHSRPRAAASPVTRQNTPLPEVADDGALRLGRNVTVKFGDRDWHAVYWGKDDQGDLVAHCTNKKWAVMHMDLARFGENVVSGEMMSRDEVLEIMAQLRGEG